MTEVRHAVVAVIEWDGKVLMMKRASTDTWPGYWSTVTGAIEPGEAQPDALIREVREEVGVTIRPSQKIWESTTRRAPFVLHWWRCELVGSPEITMQQGEVDDAKWVPISEVENMSPMFSDGRHFFRDIWPRTRTP